MSTNITHHASPHLTRAQRFSARHQRGFTIWLTGLSGSGKSTIACALEHRLITQQHLAAYRLDGDNLRFGLNRDLGFSAADRSENIRRVAEVARLFADSACVAITSFISPYREDRKVARRICTEKKSAEQSQEQGQGEDFLRDPSDLEFLEIWIDVPLEEAERRDPKGLYAKARRGEIQGFTGISPDAPYEAPQGWEEDLRICTDQMDVRDAVERIVGLLREKGLIEADSEREEEERKKKVDE
ncbi:MAG: Adenylyl-sulfate kinase [Peltula sp. TS41687]|nr:MAG: Adenylyl-sulfate kinase [Peltula sp. TS41687]